MFALQRVGMVQSYLYYPATRLAIEQHNPFHPNRDLLLQSVWTNILVTQFPLPYGFIVNPREHGCFTERDLWADVQVQHINHPGHLSFLVVICRTASPTSNGTGGITDWEDHLDSYLDLIFPPRRRGNQPVTVFGIVAFKRKASFHVKVVGEDLPMARMSQHEETGKTEFDIVEDHFIVQSILNDMSPQL
ncbi:hypothetical protein N7539_005449 [Penicillium diatomitis]|uniref:Uncharacterized protein n=1 Tax=Penicillium diatomitis TaxID=2819901 RepID=A0A9X0BV26_9EURO|nr:uncharacterized protein N7539_005449 [Penicillium diatomitis]KAJ5485461.1 hypothetical protein N7539_005449 [Penicillium diatomitis]